MPHVSIDDFNDAVRTEPHWVYCFLDEILGDPGFMSELGGRYAVVLPHGSKIDVLGGRHYASIKFELEEDAVAAHCRFGFSPSTHKKLEDAIWQKACQKESEFKQLRMELRDEVREEVKHERDQLNKRAWESLYARPSLWYTGG